MPDPTIWRPSPDVVERANVTRLGRRLGAGSYEDLLRLSREDIASFWNAVVEDLGIEFTTRYSSVLDDAAGIEWTTWFNGGRVNIAHNCVDRHRDSGRTAIAFEGQEGRVRFLTYEDLAAEVARLAGALRALGLGKGDAIGLFLPFTPEAVVAFMACAKIGAVAVPVFSGFAAPAIAARLNDSGARALICADAFFRRGSRVDMKSIADAAAEAAPTVEHVIVARRTAAELRLHHSRDVAWDDIVSGRPTQAPTEDTESEDPFLIAYTSGTTGKPKGAVHVHGGFLVKIAAETAYQTDCTADDTLFWVTDLGWIMGPWAIVGTLAAGGTLFCYDGAPDHPGPGRLWEMVERQRVSILGISPTLVRALMRHGTEPIRRRDLSSLRVLGSTGEPWNPDPWRWYFDQVGGGRCPVINFSGGTEVGACFLSPTPVSSLKPCSLGGPALGMAVDVWDDGGRPIRSGVGELVCTKPWPGMTRGIWRDPERYIQTYWSRWPGVWVHGDWASIDNDGEWFLYGRSDDTLNVAGKRIGPAEVESVLVSHDAVSEAAVVGVPDEVKGEAIVCYVVAADAGDALRAELSDLVARELGKAFRPKEVRFARELPKTRNAKVLRRAVRAVAIGADPGDLSSIENLGSLDHVAKAT
jgi:acetyl-CoA synthetase